MKRNILSLVMLILSASYAFAQSSMTDSQIMDYVIEQNAKGTSRQQIVTQLMQRGVSIDQFRRIQKKYQKQMNNETLGAVDITPGSKAAKDRMRTANGQEKGGTRNKKDVPYQVKEKTSRPVQHTYDENDKEFTEMSEVMETMLPNKRTIPVDRENQIFGHDVFNNENLTFESSMNLATPQSYRLGPGDAVNIDIWGASQESFTETISPDGTITVSGIGVIQLGGLSVSQAKSRLRSVIGPRYQGSKIDLTLGQTRTITISVMGEVNVPGTYTMSAFATVYNALYMAGGPNDIGTLRNVKVFRNGRLLSTVDVYDFLLNGHLTGDVRLQDNDVITVSPYEALVKITGKVKRPMYYEMKKTESAATLLRYAGGFTGDAYTKAIRVNRKAGSGYSVFSVGEFDMSQFKLMDKDSVSVDSTLRRYQNMVEIKGAVFRPGMYHLGNDISTVKSLIEAAAGLKEGALAQHAVMHRMKPDRTLEVLALDVAGILDGTVADIPLRNEDALYISSIEDTQTEQTITIHGEVYNPGVYRYAENETVEDFILQAGGLTDAASVMKVDVSRRIVNNKTITSTDSIAQTFTFAIKDGFVIDGEPGFHLQPYDEVYVRRSPGYNTQQNVTVSGEIMFEGNYTLTRKSQRLSEIIQKAGGVTKTAYVKGARLERVMTPEDRLRQETTLKMVRAQSDEKDSINIDKLDLGNTYYVGIELDKALAHPGSDEDIVLREGDHIIIPQYVGTVKVNGEVMYPNTVGYRAGKSVDWYVNQAGGWGNHAKKSHTYIIYMNGTVAKAGHNAKPQPGCEIVVPKKAKGNKMSLAEIMTIGTGTASIATMIATIANLISK